MPSAPQRTSAAPHGPHGCFERSEQSPLKLPRSEQSPLKLPRALVHMLEHMWCKEGRSGVRERAAGGGSEADERPEPGTGSWEQFHGLRRRRPPQRAPSTGGAKALAQGGLMLDICGGASQHSTAGGTRGHRDRSAQLDLGEFGKTPSDLKPAL